MKNLMLITLLTLIAIVLPGAAHATKTKLISAEIPQQLDRGTYEIIVRGFSAW